ncbi:MAG: hybrid sensor histidine kinase/response regulator [Pseudomonadota bacterium]
MLATEKISKIFERNFNRTLSYLGAAFLFIALLLSASFFYFGLKEAQNRAQSTIRTYRSNLVSIFILNELTALDVAISTMNESTDLVRFSRDSGQSLQLFEFREVIETAGQRHGSLIYSIELAKSLNFGILGVFISVLTATFLAVLLAFRRAQRVLISTISSPLEVLSERILASDGLDLNQTQVFEFDSLRDPETKEILDLQNALKRFSKEIRESHSVVSAAKQDQAVARMTQMIAHDVRKPFSMVKAFLDTVGGVSTIEKMSAVTEEFIPEINRALTTITGLLQDVMEISSKSKPILETASPIALVETALVDTFAYQSDTDVKFSYHFNHTLSVSIDISKVMRVFGNICDNAVQAMHGKGQLWFKTKDLILQGNSFVEFRIGNSGSFISQEDRDSLFEAFFTKNKIGGTGLGLAIAQKVVTSHGGLIGVESERDDSYPDGKVEFYFTLPTSGLPDVVTAPRRLLKSSTELRSSMRSRKMPNQSTEDGIQEVEFLWGQVTSRLRHLNRPLKILMVDDESVYKGAIQKHLSRLEGSNELIDFLTAQGSKDIPNVTLDGGILDIDLGPNSLDGFQISKKIRNQNACVFLCIHSNRTFADDSRRSLDSGADSFLPKPMSMAHFVRFLAQCTDRMAPEATLLIDSRKQHLNSFESTDEVKFSDSAKPVFRFAVVDDSNLVRMCWKTNFSEEAIDTFDSPEHFDRYCMENTEYLGSLSLVITDFHFGSLSVQDGAEFADSIRARGSSVPLFLASDGTFDADTLTVFSRIVGKLPPSSEDFQSWKSELQK